MSSFQQRNAHFDRLFATENLLWLGQNTNHLPMSGIRSAPGPLSHSMTIDAIGRTTMSPATMT